MGQCSGGGAVGVRCLGPFGLCAVLNAGASLGICHSSPWPCHNLPPGACALLMRYRSPVNRKTWISNLQVREKL